MGDSATAVEPKHAVISEESEDLSAIQGIDATEFQGVKDTTVRGNFRFFWVTLLVGFSLLEYGCDFMIGGFQAMVGFLEVFGYHDERVPSGWNIQAGPQQIISSFMLLGAFIASLATGPVGAYIGRRAGILLGCGLLLVAVTIMVVTTSMGALYASRLIIGLGNGFIMSFSFVYVSEISPPRFRGVAYGFLAAWVTFGTCIGLVITNATANMNGRLAYQIPLYTLYGMPVVILLSLPFLPESPRWLLLHRKDDQALKSLTWIRNGAYDRLALQQEFEEMKLNAEHDIANQGSVLILDMFRGTNLRRTLISVGVGLINPSSGAMFVLGFGTYFFKVVGVVDPFKWIILTQFLGLFGQILSFWAVVWFGRRTMMLSAATGCALSMLVLGIVSVTPSLKGTDALEKLIIFLFSVFLFCFDFGLAPCTYLVAGEIPAQNLRAYTSGLSTGMGFFFAWLTAFTGPYFINPAELNWSGKYGFVWFGSTCTAIIFIYLCVPEMRGRTLEEIEEMFDKRVPAKNFSTYVCQNTIAARDQAERDLFGDAKAAAMHVETVERV